MSKLRRNNGETVVILIDIEKNRKKNQQDEDISRCDIRAKYII